jgi:F-box interacting protein
MENPKRQALALLEQANIESLYIPVEVIRQSFSWPSVKAIIRNKAVCSSFNSMMLEKSFINLHLSRAPRNKWLTELDGNRSEVSFLMKNKENTLSTKQYGSLRKGWKPVTSYNGILCSIRRVFATAAGGPDIKIGFKAHFANLATMQFSPISEFLHYEEDCYPLTGFGWESVNDIYKLVMLLPTTTGEISTRVHNVGSSDWRTIDQNFPGIPLWNVSYDVPHRFMRKGAFINGSLNWLAKDINAKAVFYVQLNLEPESFGRKSLPRNLDITYMRNPNITVLKERLVFSYFSKSRKTFEVWRQEDLMNEDSWMRLASIAKSELGMADEEWQVGVPLLVMDSFDNGIIMMAKTLSGVVLFYNCNEQTVFGNYRLPGIPWIDGSCFVQSLVKPW